ncbi:hypothetical protein SHLO109777_14955 [Shewanella loihica]|uniref:Orphan protein n=1 Tax=Shewanella loihica (strain ATCC BAA-1088 / PV-4) TaxID=323850 RepID=A3Q8T7_SHELP|nr:hypothetical protein [Shewanella loihica]ABO21885.1 hypothetical protein Shew_0012 [Shewanella loihica PV-4]
MKSLKLPLLILLSASAIAYLMLEADHAQPRDEPKIPIAQADQDRSAQRQSPAQTQTDSKVETESLVSDTDNGNKVDTDTPEWNEVEVEEDKQTSAKLLVAQIIDAQGVVDGEQIKKLFDEDLEAYVDLIESLDNHDATSQQRQTALADRLTHLPETIYSEKYACGDRICVLSLTTDTISQQSIDKLSEFDKNYAFIKQTQLDTGETQFQAIYLQTDDPSTMRFKGY